MQQPTLTQKQYDAIMALQPKTCEDFERLLAESFLGRTDETLNRLGKTLYEKIMEEVENDGLISPERYCLKRIEAHNEGELSTATLILDLMISSAERQGLVDDKVYTDFVLLQPHLNEECQSPSPVINLFKIAN